MIDSQNNRDYIININPRILELLGPNLYTNIYYVLAELIANSYDAWAKNVYIIEKDDAIIVEDDGMWMSYTWGDINKYLNVAWETRLNSEQVFVPWTNRKKMGRKWVWKLAALSVSENVYVITRKDWESSWFILSRHIESDNRLEPLPDEKIQFEFINSDDNWTSIIMNNPEYWLHRTLNSIKKNLLKIFPIVSNDFQIHIVRGAEHILINEFDKEIIGELWWLIILWQEYYHLAEYFNSCLEERSKVEPDLLKLQNAFSKILRLKNRLNQEKDYEILIKWWIWAYRTTRWRKIDQNDFPDNFISILSNWKLGEFNILPLVWKNRLSEVYIVWQLTVDLLEETELPDIALSNRQWYITDDERYKVIKTYIGDVLLPEIVNIRDKYWWFLRYEKEKAKQSMILQQEKLLIENVKQYKNNASKGLADRLKSLWTNLTQDQTEKIIKEEIDKNLPDLWLKRTVDSQKKRILISHTRNDKQLADIIYNMLSFNWVHDEVILYTNSSNSLCRIPEWEVVYDYLRKFFVESISNQKIFVIYVTSEDMCKSWNAVIEVWAWWITQSEHRVFNIRDHTPLKPLNTDIEWHSSNRVNWNIEMDAIGFDKFIIKIMNICSILGYVPKDKSLNERELKKYVTITF